VLVLGNLLFPREARTGETASVPSDDVLFRVVDGNVLDLGLVVGGRGNEPMLKVFRTVLFEFALEAFPNAEPERSVGISGVEAGCGDSNADGREGAFSRDGVPRLFLGAFFCGIGGRAAVGGSAGGRERTGSDIVTAPHTARVLRVRGLAGESGENKRATSVSSNY